MSAVAQTLEVARAHISERRGRTAKPRGQYRTAEDAGFLPAIRAIRAIVDARPTYGYRRVGGAAKAVEVGHVLLRGKE